MSNQEPIKRKDYVARWYHTDDHASPNLSKASLGLFFFECLSRGAHIGEIWPSGPAYNKSPVYVSVFMTEEIKEEIEAETKFRFRDPPKFILNALELNEAYKKNGQNT